MTKKNKKYLFTDFSLKSNSGHLKNHACIILQT